MFEEGKSPQEDWRYINGDCLKDCIFKYRDYRPTEPDNDHDHCAFCWAKFYPEKLDADTQTAGYVTFFEEDYDPRKHEIQRGADGSVIVPKALKTNGKVRVFYWVCKECFKDFKDVFNLKIK